MKYLKITLLVFLEILREKKALKKKALKMTSQSTGHFQSFFIYFFSSPDPRSEKKFP